MVDSLIKFVEEEYFINEELEELKEDLVKARKLRICEIIYDE
jgi:hypothetical protein